MNGLLKLSQRLDERAGSTPVPYRIPSLWLPAPQGDAARVTEVNPYTFFRDALRGILDKDLPPRAGPAKGGKWTERAVVYNMFVRQTTAWDHDGDGRIGLDDLPGGFRETGTFLKAIALLPYLKRLGINTLHLLPVTLIGSDGNKGTLGSPYAIKNPFKLDPRLAEPWLGLDVEVEFSAFVEAAHRLGIRVVMEFVFRTAAKDSEWIADHPDWFYWIDAEVPDRGAGADRNRSYGNPRFTSEELQLINTRVRRNDLASLPPPPMDYRLMFAEAPEKPGLLGGRFKGVSPDGRGVRVPGAFADWPPDDVQPPWDDVTYLKLYQHPAFNYIAYNTIRVYDSRLAQADNENRGLWNTIGNIIPHYQQTFKIDGVMIDMGHALPKRLKQSIVDRARKNDRDFAFWEENFAISSRSVQEGYNAAVGYLVFDEHLPHKLKEFFHFLASQDVPVPFFATAETHNTHRAASRPGGIVFSRLALTLNAFLPAVFYLHQGVELGETFPVNTGLGFSPEEIAQLPSRRLPLFSESALCWDNSADLTEHVSGLNRLRAVWECVVADPRKSAFSLRNTSDERTVCYVRSSPDKPFALAVLANLDCFNSVRTSVELPTEKTELREELTGTVIRIENGVTTVDLKPGEAMVLPLTGPPV